MTFIPLPDSSVRSVRTSYIPVPGYGACLCRNTRGRSVSCVQHHTLPEKLCEFCMMFIRYPICSVSPLTLVHFVFKFCIEYIVQESDRTLPNSSVSSVHQHHNNTLPKISVSSVRLSYPTRQFCKICTDFVVPVPRYGVCLSRNTRGRSVSSVKHHALLEMFCEFCKTP